MIAKTILAVILSAITIRALAQTPPPSADVRKAGELGNAAAQTSLGDAYYFGRGVPKDPTEAVRWYRKAAEQGDAYAQVHLEESGTATPYAVLVDLTHSHSTLRQTVLKSSSRGIRANDPFLLLGNPGKSGTTTPYPSERCSEIAPRGAP